MLEKLESVRENFKELTDKLSNPKVIANQSEFQKLAKGKADA
jgi:protein subunit release factor A